MPDTYDPSDYEETTGPFDAFRARRAQEQAANEPFPEQYAQPMPQEPAVPRTRRGRLRSVAVLAGVAVIVAVVVGGVYAATRSSSGTPMAAPGPAASASASASPSAEASKGAKNARGKAATAMLTVTSVSGDSFAATAADGRAVTVQITATTRFGTAVRPFTRSQLVAGAVVYARLRREVDGSVVATVIASAGGAGA